MITRKCEKCKQSGVFFWCRETCCWRCPNCQEELHYKTGEQDENTGFNHGLDPGTCSCVDVMRNKL